MRLCDLDTIGIDALRREAQSRLAEDAFAFFDAVARRGATRDANADAWARLWFRPRRLTGAGPVRLHTTLLGQSVAHPIIVGPAAAHRLADAAGELATARAVRSNGGIMILSTSSTCPVEEVADCLGRRLWFQLYPFEDNSLTASLVRRAVSAGASAIVFTVDVTSAGNPTGVSVSLPRGVSWSHYDVYARARTRFSWDDVRRLQDIAGVPLVLKGILHPEDAARAVDEGVGAVMVSNHGGRTLDGELPTALALPSVASAVDGRIEVYVDSGLQSGADVLRALALGARAAALVRPVLWALAVAGEAGVDRFLKRLIRELAEDLELAGLDDVTAVPQDLVCMPP